MPTCKIDKYGQEGALLYKQGKSVKEIENILPIKRSTIYKSIKHHNIPLRPASNANHDYFEKVNYKNLNQAYILGLICADGCLAKCERQVVIDLVEQDKYILEFIQKELNLTNKLYFREFEQKSWQNTYKLCICSVKIYQDLLSLGLERNKTINLSWPDCIPVDFSSDYCKVFFKGFFDGDGHLGCNVESKRTKFSLLSTKNMCDNIKCLLGQLGVHSTIYKHDNKFYYLSVGGTQNIIRICRWMYHNSKFHMKRKYVVYQKIEQMFNKRRVLYKFDPSNRNIIINIRQLYKNGTKVSDIAKKYGWKYGSVYSICIGRSFKYIK